MSETKGEIRYSISIVKVIVMYMVFIVASLDSAVELYSLDTILGHVLLCTLSALKGMQ